MNEKQEPIIIKLSTMIFIIMIILLAIGIMAYNFLKDQKSNTEMINSLKNDINKIERQIEVLENNSKTNDDVESEKENSIENSINTNQSNENTDVKAKASNNTNNTTNNTN